MTSNPHLLLGFLGRPSADVLQFETHMHVCIPNWPVPLAVRTDAFFVLPLVICRQTARIECRESYAYVYVHVHGAVIYNLPIFECFAILRNRHT